MSKNVYNYCRPMPTRIAGLYLRRTAVRKSISSLLPLLLTLCVSTFAFSAPAASPAALTPPMGWNSWNHFGNRVTDQTIRDTADAMVASGMRDAGYIYVNIDDTWEGT